MELYTEVQAGIELGLAEVKEMAILSATPTSGSRLAIDPYVDSHSCQSETSSSSTSSVSSPSSSAWCADQHARPSADSAGRMSPRDRPGIALSASTNTSS